MPPFRLRPHVVRQGDYLEALGAKHGFDPDTAWNDPKNSALKEARKGDGNVLRPGDVLYIPDVPRTWSPVQIGTVNTFTAPTRKVHVKTRFVADGEPLAGEPYIVEGVNIPGGSLDGDGNFSAVISTYVTSFVLHLTQRNEAYEIRVGDLDPAHEPSGVRMRLGMLGVFGRGAATCADGDGHLEVGLRLFQDRHKLNVTGELDDATVQKVLEVFGR